MMNNVLQFTGKTNGSSALEVDYMDDHVLIDHYLNTKRSEGTKEQYELAIRKFSEWLKKPLVEATRWDMSNYSKFINETYKNDKTVNRIQSVIRNFYKYLAGMEVIEKSPCEIVFKTLKINNTPTERVMTNAEINAILKVASKSARDHAVTATLATTGIRVSELCGLDWCDIYVNSKGTYSMHVLRKGDEEQELPILSELVDILIKYKKKGLDKNDHTPLFSVLYAKKQGRMTTEAVRKLITKLADKAGVEGGVTPHWFRHTFASKIVANGGGLEDLRRYLNHKDIKTTQGYLHGMEENIGKFLDFNLQGKDDE